MSKSGWGGFRPNSGRKKLSVKKVKTSITLDAELLEWLNLLNESRSIIIDKALRLYKTKNDDN